MGWPAATPGPSALRAALAARPPAAAATRSAAARYSLRAHGRCGPAWAPSPCGAFLQLAAPAAVIPSVRWLPAATSSTPCMAAAPAIRPTAAALRGSQSVYRNWSRGGGPSFVSQLFSPLAVARDQHCDHRAQQQQTAPGKWSTGSAHVRASHIRPISANAEPRQRACRCVAPQAASSGGGRAPRGAGGPRAATCELSEEQEGRRRPGARHFSFVL